MENGAGTAWQCSSNSSAVQSSARVHPSASGDVMRADVVGGIRTMTDLAPNCSIERQRNSSANAKQNTRLVFHRKYFGCMISTLENNQHYTNNENNFLTIKHNSRTEKRRTEFAGWKNTDWNNYVPHIYWKQKCVKIPFKLLNQICIVHIVSSKG